MARRHTLSQAEQNRVVAQTIAAEAGGGGTRAMQAVANVIQNRAAATGQTPYQVVMNGGFEGRTSTSSGAVANRNNRALVNQAAQIMSSVQSGELEDVTGGADHYYSPRGQSALGRNAPGWADPSRQTASIGGNTFYRLNSAPLPPADIPMGSAALGYVDAPQPATLNSALQAIQKSTAPSNWADFYSSLLPEAPGPIAAPDYEQLTSPQAVSGWYGQFGLPPASGAPPVSDYATITTPRQAGDFYSGFGLPAAPRSVLPSAWPTLPQAQSSGGPSDSLRAMYDPALGPYWSPTDNMSPYVNSSSTALAPPTAPSVLPATWPTLPGGGNTNVGSFEDVGADGSINLFQPRSVALPAGVRPNVPSAAPELMQPKTATGNPLASLFASSVPASLTAPTLDSATAYSQPPYQSLNFTDPAPAIGQSVIERTPASSGSLAQAQAAINSRPSVSGNFGSPGAMDSPLYTPQPSAPTYETVTKYKTVSQQVPIEAGDGVTWNAATNNYELSAPQYKTVTKQVPYTVKVPVQAAPVAPVFPASPPESELRDLRAQAANPLARLASNTPLGHIVNFLNGSDAAYGGTNGGLLSYFARPGSSPLASLFGGLTPQSTLAATAAAMTPQQRTNQNPLGLAAQLSGQQAYQVDGAGGLVPAFTMGGQLRNTYGDTAAGLGLSLTQN
jgi:hypothetical protein